MKLNPQSELRRLTDNFPNPGRLDWIGVRAAPRGAVLDLTHALAIADGGLEGDHRARRPGSKRQVTLIQLEHLSVVALLLNQAEIAPQLTRRNLVVSGINLLALHDQLFRIGEVMLEGTGLCEPCSRMEAHLGDGGYNAMRGHGGITARVVTGGVMRLGDVVMYESCDEPK